MSPAIVGEGQRPRTCDVLEPTNSNVHYLFSVRNMFQWRLKVLVPSDVKWPNSKESMACLIFGVRNRVPRERIVRG